MRQDKINALYYPDMDVDPQQSCPGYILCNDGMQCKFATTPDKPRSQIC